MNFFAGTIQDMFWITYFEGLKKFRKAESAKEIFTLIFLKTTCQKIAFGEDLVS